MEGKGDVGKNPEVEDVKADSSGKYPETVSWSQYVGIKEKLGREKQEAQEKVKSLEERLKDAPSKDEYDKTKAELEKTKQERDSFSQKIKEGEEKSATELRESLKAKGLSDEDVKDLTVAEMQRILKVSGSVKPKLDLGTGGGSGSLEGVPPMELARRAYEQKAK